MGHDHLWTEEESQERRNTKLDVVACVCDDNAAEIGRQANATLVSQSTVQREL